MEGSRLPMDLEIQRIQQGHPYPKVKCNCGNDAVIRTVKNGPNVGSKFYVCPLSLVSLITLLECC
ncbi:DNA topoisomerase 3-alpha [Bienertia sinuspersici]